MRGHVNHRMFDILPQVGHTLDMSLNGQALVNIANTGSTHLKSIAVRPNPDTITDYNEYINSPHWDGLKAKSRQMWGCNCLVCGTDANIERHHIFYRENLCDGKPAEIIPLCYECHKAAHVDGANKNSEPGDEEAMKRIINKLFHQIVRQRNFPTAMIGRTHERFWHTYDKVDKPVKAEKSKEKKKSRKQKKKKKTKRQKRQERRERDSKTPLPLPYESQKGKKQDKRHRGKPVFKNANAPVKHGKWGHGFTFADREGYRAGSRWASIR